MRPAFPLDQQVTFWVPEIAYAARGMDKFAAILKMTKIAFALSLTLAQAGSVAHAQDSSKPSEEEANHEVSTISYGAENDFSSGYAFRGLAISDRPVASQAAWISTAGFGTRWPGLHGGNALGSAV